MTTTSLDTDQFARDGILIRRNLVPSPLVERAQELIGAWSSTQMRSDQLDAYTQRTFAPELGSHPDLLNLFHDSGVAALVTELLPDIQPVTTTQIQIRVPDHKLPQPVKAMHVDGVACPHLDPNELRTFTLLAGVVLSDITNPDGGALHYVPGGHLTMADWFRTQWAIGMTDQVPPQVDAEHGIPFLGKPGDVLLMHHLVPHAVGRNTTPDPRVMAYFRISHASHHHQRLEALRDPWLEFPALRPGPRRTV